eukprot:GHVT01075671.1.p1 GENE.GHVT01075671.1~~GHVT01075671.1.p1  ORF type:complete len:222 (-),score=12.50 GHVT01075671.1:5-670(-)
MQLLKHIKTLKMYNVHISGSPDIVSKTDEKKHVEEWTVDDVAEWLKTQSFKDDVIEAFKKTDMDGQSLFLFNTNEIVEHLGIKYGTALRIDAARKKLKEELDKAPTERPLEPLKMEPDTEEPCIGQETYRPFDKAVHPTFKYKKNGVLPVPDDRPGNLLTPIHRYIADVKEPTKFATHVVEFAAACLNDRTNGTIHFGIKDSKNVFQIHGLIVDQSNTILN